MLLVWNTKIPNKYYVTGEEDGWSTRMCCTKHASLAVLECRN